MKTVNVDSEAPHPGNAPDPLITYNPLKVGKLYGSLSSFLKDLTNHPTYRYSLHKTENATMYSYIEQAARNSNYLTMIKPFETQKYGRGPWLTILASYVGNN